MMAFVERRVVPYFNEFCKKLTNKNLTENFFEGLADITKLPNGGSTYFKYHEKEKYCVINGSYRVGKNGKKAAVAIGLWDDAKGCFSVLTKTKDGKSLPPPLRVEDKEAKIIFETLASARSLEDVLKQYKIEVQKRQ